MKWFVIVIILSIILISGCTQQLTDQAISQEQSQTTKSQIYTDEVKNLLPKRDEINTEYKIVASEDKTNISGYFSNYQTQGLKTIGFENGSYMELEILEGTTITAGYITILRFDSVDNANLFYTSLINFIKNEGGYKELSSFGINADCFALEGGNYMEGYYQDAYCKKKNIFFNTEVSSFKRSRLPEYEDWANIIANKI
jgi:hypothetical protein